MFPRTKTGNSKVFSSLRRQHAHHDRERPARVAALAVIYDAHSARQGALLLSIPLVDPSLLGLLRIGAGIEIFETQAAQSLRQQDLVAISAAAHGFFADANRHFLFQHERRAAVSIELGGDDDPRQTTTAEAGRQRRNELDGAVVAGEINRRIAWIEAIRISRADIAAENLLERAQALADVGSGLRLCRGTLA